MNIETRIDLLVDLGNYLGSEEADWKSAKQKASAQNAWFTEGFIAGAVKNICLSFLEREKLTQWCSLYPIAENKDDVQTVGLVMAGNIPLVGFHDFLSIFISGHIQVIKPSSKDETLIKHIVHYLSQRNPAVHNFVSFGEMLKGCDAYIATGNNNSARYFEYYLGKYPHIIRRNRTSVAILHGAEQEEALEKLAEDISLYFGLGCRSVTKIYVPEGYDFLPLLGALKKFGYFSDHAKYKNNYDYQLAILIINGKYYMTNGSVILSENSGLFSPISVLHVEYYKNIHETETSIKANLDIQCAVGKNFLPFGTTQRPSLMDYADGKDTLEFLTEL